MNSHGTLILIVPTNRAFPTIQEVPGPRRIAMKSLIIQILVLATFSWAYAWEFSAPAREIIT